MWQDEDLCARELVADADHDQSCDAYNEEAFRYFLGIERKRAERSERSLLLLLVALKSDTAVRGAMDHAIAGKLFSGLTCCVREVDFVGWFRAGRVAGAVLTQGALSPASDASQRVGQRVAEELSERLPPQVASRLEVRVLQLCSTLKN